MLNYTEAEGKVREATNEDPWGNLFFEIEFPYIWITFSRDIYFLEPQPYNISSDPNKRMILYWFCYSRSN